MGFDRRNVLIVSGKSKERRGRENKKPLPRDWSREREIDNAVGALVITMGGGSQPQ